MKNLSRRKGAFTLLELIVNIAIMAVLASVLLPAFARVRETANKTSCGGNLRQLSLGILQYTQDYDDSLPPYTNGSGVWLPARLMPYTSSTQLWKCPSSLWEADAWDGTVQDWSVSYGINAQLSGYGSARALSSISKTAETVLLCENSFNPVGAAVVDPLYPNVGRPFARHEGSLNVCFADGHVKSYKQDSLQKIAFAEDGTSLYGINSSVLWNTY